jgi:glycosyltransferase involved in cell wall biosynthesis
MLSDWALRRGRLKKMLAWRTYQRRDLAVANAFHVTSHQEAEEVRSLGFRQPIAVVPNGIKCPETMPPNERLAGRRRMLFLSRIHPKKGLPNLLRAWRKAAPPAEWQLLIAGPDANGHAAEVRQLAADLQLDGQVSFHGPVADDEKWALYRRADLFVLPSFSENFGIVVGEALAAELPVIATVATPWRALQEQKIGWWVQPSVEDLAKAIANAVSLADGQREVMGKNGAAWVRKYFSWISVAQQMTQFYQWLLNGGVRPPHVLPMVNALAIHA